MSNPSKQKGTAAETRVVNFLLAAGLDARRVVLKGSKDEGDIHVDDPLRLIGATLEVKAGKQTARPSRTQMAEWLAEACKEGAACGREAYLVIARHRCNPRDYEVWSADGHSFCYLDEFAAKTAERRTA